MTDPDEIRVVCMNPDEFMRALQRKARERGGYGTAHVNLRRRLSAIGTNVVWCKSVGRYTLMLVKRRPT